MTNGPLYRAAIPLFVDSSTAKPFTWKTGLQQYGGRACFYVLSWCAVRARQIKGRRHLPGVGDSSHSVLNNQKVPVTYKIRLCCGTSVYIKYAMTHKKLHSERLDQQQDDEAIYGHGM